MNVRYKCLVIGLAGVAITAGCADSDADRYSTADNTYGSATQPETDVTTMPDAVVIERTAVVSLDTNAQIAATSTNSSPDSSASGAAPGSAIESSSPESIIGSSAASTNTNTNGIDESGPQSDAKGGAASSEQGEGASSAQMASSKFIDFKVQDANGTMIGTVQEVWDDQQGNPRFLAVRTERKQDLCIIPSSEVQQSQNREVLKVPYSAEILKQAPTLKTEENLDAEAQQKIMTFFAQHEGQGSPDEQADAQGSAQNEQRGASESQIANAERTDEATIRLKEEQLKIGKRKVEAGGILLRKVVRTETVNKPVQLRREEFVIERVPGSGKPADENAQFAEREVFIPLFREEPVVEKDVVLKEVINVGKSATQEQDTVNAKLREEELRIIRQGEAQAAAGTAASSESGTAQGSAQNDNQQQQAGETQESQAQSTISNNTGSDTEDNQ